MLVVKKNKYGGHNHFDVIGICDELFENHGGKSYSRCLRSFNGSHTVLRYRYIAVRSPHCQEPYEIAVEAKGIRDAEYLPGWKRMVW